MCVSLCFSSSSQVKLGLGGSRNISDLGPYEQLLTIGVDKSQQTLSKVKSSPFYTYIHFEPDVTTEFLVLNCENNLQLVISEAHLLFRKRLQDVNPKPTMAKKVEVGDYLIHVNSVQEIQHVKVIGIERKDFQGVFAPLTKSGTLIVDGFLVSCYAQLDSHTKAHVSMAPLRLWYKLRSKIGKSGAKVKRSNGIHKYARMWASLYGIRLSN